MFFFFDLKTVRTELLKIFQTYIYFCFSYVKGSISMVTITENITLTFKLRSEKNIFTFEGHCKSLNELKFTLTLESTLKSQIFEWKCMVYFSVLEFFITKAFKYHYICFTICCRSRDVRSCPKQSSFSALFVKKLKKKLTSRMLPYLYWFSVF